MLRLLQILAQVTRLSCCCRVLCTGPPPAQHFASGAMSLKLTRSFDAARILTMSCMVAGERVPVLMLTAELTELSGPQWATACCGCAPWTTRPSCRSTTCAPRPRPRRVAALDAPLQSGTAPPRRGEADWEPFAVDVNEYAVEASSRPHGYRRAVASHHSRRARA